MLLHPVEGRTRDSEGIPPPAIDLARYCSPEHLIEHDVRLVHKRQHACILHTIYTLPCSCIRRPSTMVKLRLSLEDKEKSAHLVVGNSKRMRVRPTESPIRVWSSFRTLDLPSPCPRHRKGPKIWDLEGFCYVNASHRTRALDEYIGALTCFPRSL